MGTPHCGANMLAWARAATVLLKLKRSSDKILKQLEGKSDALRDTQEYFCRLLRKRNGQEGLQSGQKPLEIVNFYEEIPIRALGKVYNSILFNIHCQTTLTSSLAKRSLKTILQQCQVMKIVQSTLITWAWPGFRTQLMTGTRPSLAKSWSGFVNWERKVSCKRVKRPRTAKVCNRADLCVYIPHRLS